MANLTTILQYIVNVCTIVISTITAISVALKLRRLATKSGNEERKENEDCESVDEDFESLYKLMASIIPQAIMFAEKAGVPDGATKKMLCEAQVMLDCAKNKIDYNTFAEFISLQIDNVVSMTKEVNVNK